MTLLRHYVIIYIMSKREKMKYQRLAYSVIRDAIGFYFGIPVFLEKYVEADVIEIYQNLGDTDIDAIKHKIACRISSLEADYSHCLELLSEDNIWYQLLELDSSVFFNYLQNLSDSEKSTLAIVPRWTTPDHNLGRPYINNNFTTYDSDQTTFSYIR